MLSKLDRLKEFIKRLERAEPCSSADEAFELIVGTLNSVEDELSGVAYDPTNWMADGRMYPPREDSRRDIPGRPDLRRYRSIKHQTYIDDHGAILIEERDGTWILNKPGRSGRSLELPPRRPTK